VKYHIEEVDLMTVTDHASPPAHPTQPAPRGSQGGHVALLVIGTVLALVGLTLAAAAAAFGWATLLQRNGAFLTSPNERYEVASYAITSQQLEIVTPQVVQGDLTRLRLRAESADPNGEIFVGIGPQAEVARYLADVEHSEITDVRFAPFEVRYRTVPGTAQPTPPGQQDFWTVQDEGTGPQQIEFAVRTGAWMAVIMNADGSRGVTTDLQAGARSDLSGPITAGVSAGALLLLVAGISMLVLGAAGLGRHAGSSPAAATPGAGPSGAMSGYPARVTGQLDPQLSRWLWLVKWILIIPHVVVLAFLYLALVVTTLVAAVAILVTGRYPRSLFDFNVGVLRWGWRVGFYAYSALGTDQYPPFTLARTDYPADFDVEYPDRLSRGLVLVKSWLLAIPHLVVVAAITGNAWYWVNSADYSTVDVRQVGGISLMGILVLIAAVVLLFTGRYPRAIFDLLMGLNRWIYRVVTYVGLLRDEYPPFRLDQGAGEPGMPDHTEPKGDVPPPEPGLDAAPRPPVTPAT
jgi:hypothetical protein